MKYLRLIRDFLTPTDAVLPVTVVVLLWVDAPTVLILGVVTGYVTSFLFRQLPGMPVYTFDHLDLPPELIQSFNFFFANPITGLDTQAAVRDYTERRALEINPNDIERQWQDAPTPIIVFMLPQGDQVDDPPTIEHEGRLVYAPDDWAYICTPSDVFRSMFEGIDAPEIQTAIDAVEDAAGEGNIFFFLWLDTGKGYQVQVLLFKIRHTTAQISLN